MFEDMLPSKTTLLVNTMIAMKAANLSQSKSTWHSLLALFAVNSRQIALNCILYKTRYDMMLHGMTSRHDLTLNFLALQSKNYMA